MNYLNRSFGKIMSTNPEFIEQMALDKAAAHAVAQIVAPAFC